MYWDIKTVKPLPDNHIYVMYVRCTQIRSNFSVKCYYTYHLVQAGTGRYLLDTKVGLGNGCKGSNGKTKAPPAAIARQGC
ncbi:hypothetical protein SAMN05421755_11016 [Nitrosomonas sp. Nm33]|nr:hypothetical protein SAMN05421755_11016 [Nitrosomonas sp. Nm33]